MTKSTNDGGLGTEGKQARKLLEKRGVTDRIVGQARGLLDQIGTLEDLTDADEADEAAAAEDMETELWNWYLEWSGIARVAIRDRRLLRALGFLRPVRKSNGEVVDEVVSDDEVATDATDSTDGTDPTATTTTSPSVATPVVTEPIEAE